MANGTNGVPTSAVDQKIVDELHCYLRHNMQLWVAWFTFFVTINYVGLGWFASEIFKGGHTDPDTRPLHYVAAVFVIQCILGIWASLIWRRQLNRISSDISTIYSALRRDAGLPEFSGKAYGYAILLGAAALVTIIFAWCFLALRP
jgi:hypothetical protein